MSITIDTLFRDFVIAGVGAFLGTIGGALAANSYAKNLKKEENLKNSIKDIYFSINIANQTLNQIYSFYVNFSKDYDNYQINRQLSIQIFKEIKSRKTISNGWETKKPPAKVKFDLNIYPDLKINLDRVTKILDNPTILSPRDIALISEISNTIELLQESIRTRNTLIQEFKGLNTVNEFEKVAKIYGLEIKNIKDETFHIVNVSIKTYLNDFFFYNKILLNSLNEINKKIHTEFKYNFDESASIMQSVEISSIDELIIPDTKHQKWLENTNDQYLIFRKNFKKPIIFLTTIREPLHKSPKHVLAHACRVRKHPGPCSNSISA